MGSGHIFRCRTLARQLQLRGADVVFLCRFQPGHLIELLMAEFCVVALPEQALLSTHRLSGRDLYRAWLGCTQAQDANDCITALHLHGIFTIDILIVDHYALDHEWEKSVSEGFSTSENLRILAIDDLADRQHSADYLLDQNFFGLRSSQRYSELVPKQCRQFLGPHYALLGPEYSSLHPLVSERKNLSRVLIFFGGIDPFHLTKMALCALLQPQFNNLTVDIVLGMQSADYDDLRFLVSQRANTTLYESVDSLAGLMSRADLAIGAGGSTTWERACLSLPSLVVAVSDNQLPFIEVLHKQKFCTFLGKANDISIDNFKEGIEQVLSKDLFHRSGKQLTDGFGSIRLTTALLGFDGEPQLRLVLPTDEELLLRWANEPSVRVNSFNQAWIPHDSHHNWFVSGLRSPDRLHWILVDTQKCPLGQIRFDRICGTNIATVDLSIDLSARGFGLAPTMLMNAMSLIPQHWGDGIQVCADVFCANAPSQSTFAKAGFAVDQNHSNNSVIRWIKTANS